MTDSDGLPFILDQGKRTKEDMILEASAVLFAEKGFHRTTTREIADKASVAEGTLYNYFKNKDDILMGIMTRLSQNRGWENTLTKTLTEDVQETLHTILEQRNQFILENKAMLYAVYSEMMVKPELQKRYYREMLLPMITAIQDNVQARIDQGDMRVVDAAISSRLLVALMNGIFLLSILGDDVVNDQWDVLDEAIVDLFFRGYQK